jgi:hypothetical protein
MNKPYNIQNTNICNGIFHVISFFKALLINEGVTTCGEMTWIQLSSVNFGECVEIWAFKFICIH